MLNRDVAPKKMPWWKYGLAALGVVYAIGTVIWIVLLVSKTYAPSGPTALAMHPEQQDALLALRRAEKMQADLGLTPEQTEQVAKIMEGFHAERKERFLSAPEGQPMARMQAMMELREKVRTELSTVLTPEQLEQYSDGQQQRFSGVFSALRESGIAPVNAAAAPKTPEDRRERLLNVLKPVAPTAAP